MPKMSSLYTFCYIINKNGEAILDEIESYDNDNKHYILHSPTGDYYVPKCILTSKLVTE